MRKLTCILRGHRWTGWLDLAVCHCERCGKELRGKPARKALRMDFIDSLMRERDEPR